MKRTIRWRLAAAASALALVVSGFAAAPAHAAIWSTCDQWGNWTSGGYTLYNNIWGSGDGPQCTWANSATNWGVWANHPNTGGVKSYPNSTRWSGKRVSALGTLSSSFNVSVPTSGSRSQHLRRLVQRQRLRNHAVGQQVRRGRPDRQLPDHGHRGRPQLERLPRQQRCHRRVLVPAHQQHLSRAPWTSRPSATGSAAVAGSAT